MSDEHTTIDNLEDALSALKRARQDAATQRTKAKEAREALDALTAERDELATKLKEAEDTTDGLSALIEEISERAGLDLSGLESAKDDAEVVKVLDAAFKPLSDLQAQAQEAGALRRERDLTAAAQALGKPADALAEILDGKTLTSRKEAQEGQEVDVWGIGEGDTFKPLSDLKAVQYLASEPTTAPKPPAAPLPTGGAGGKPAPENPVQARIKARQEAQTAPTDPFKPHTGGNS